MARCTTFFGFHKWGKWSEYDCVARRVNDVWACRIGMRRICERCGMVHEEVTNRRRVCDPPKYTPETEAEAEAESGTAIPASKRGVRRLRMR